ncbi:MAG: hypothetical protein EOL93_01930 [Epsilonproteobacteria bacterium]|nr:hypothetical protein [Campylobacterota bacterium]
MEGFVAEIMDEVMRHKIIACLYRDREFCMSAAEYIKPDHFIDSPVEHNFSKIGLDFWNKFRTTCTDFVFTESIKYLIEKKIVKKEDVPIYVEFYAKIKKLDISDSVYVSEAVVSFVKKQEYRKIIEDAVTRFLPKGDFDSIEKEMKRIATITAQQDRKPYSYFGEEEIKNRTERRQRSLLGIETGISTGIKKIDEILPNNGFFRKELYNFMAGPKTGKCVRRDTMIFTEDGLCEIGNYVPKDMAPDSYADKQINILAMDGMEKSSHIYNNGFGKTKKITLENGIEIECTPNHPLMARTIDGENWVASNDLSVGDWLVCKYGSSIYGKNTDLSYAVNESVKRLNGSKRKDAINMPNLPYFMDESLAKFIAMIVAEGHIGVKAFSFTQKEDSTFNEFVSLLTDLFGVDGYVNPNTKKTKSIVVSNVVLIQYLKSLGITGRLSKNMVIPRSILMSPKPILTAFLRVLLSLEGSVYRRSDRNVCFEITLASETLIRQLQMCLINVGVTSSIDKKVSFATNGKRIKRNYWRLCIRGSKNLKLFKDEIGLYDKRKNDFINDFSFEPTERKSIPFAEKSIRDIIDSLLKADLNIASLFSQPERKSLYRFANGQRVLTMSFLNKICDRLSGVISCAGLNDLKNIKDGGLVYVKIKSIEDSECETVDVSMPETHSFIGNGIINHNTFALLFFANVAALNGYNVAYFSGETSIEVMTDRVDAMNAEIETRGIAIKSKDVQASILACRPPKGDIFFFEYPTKVLKCSEVERQVRKIEQSYGQKIDMIISDYTGTMRPEQYYGDKLSEEASIYEGLRALATIFECPVLTASQINRMGAGKAIVTGADKAGTYEAIMVADYNISFSASAEDLKRAQLVIHFSECRNIEKKTIRIATSYGTGRFYRKFLDEVE